MDEKKRARRERMGQQSSTVVAFVRGVAKTDVLLKKGLWLGGSWYSVNRYEAVQPVRVKRGWCWVGERLDEVMTSEEAALRKVNGSVDGIFKAVAELGRLVNEMRLERQVKGDHWSDKLGKKRKEDSLAAHLVKGNRGSGVSFMTKVMKENDGS